MKIFHLTEKNYKRNLAITIFLIFSLTIVVFYIKFSNFYSALFSVEENNLDLILASIKFSNILFSILLSLLLVFANILNPISLITKEKIINKPDSFILEFNKKSIKNHSPPR